MFLLLDANSIINLCDGTFAVQSRSFPLAPNVMNRWHVVVYLALSSIIDHRGDLLWAYFVFTRSPQHQGCLSLDLSHKHTGQLNGTSCSQQVHSANSLPPGGRLGTVESLAFHDFTKHKTVCCLIVSFRVNWTDVYNIEIQYLYLHWG